MPYLLQHVLSESAARVPDKEALRFGGEGMTYAQLEIATNQLARWLRKNGVKRGDRVGIYLHKSPASVISVFGVLKAGGTYVPLDPNAPAKRLAYITSDCDVNVLLTSAQKVDGIAELLNEGAPVMTIVVMDGASTTDLLLPERTRVVSWAEVAAEDDSSGVPDLAIESDLAYILYTSGSTGDSKGVMISHRTIFTFIDWCRKTFRMDENDRVTSHAPLQFDLSTFDIYVTIQCGGTIILVPETLSVFPERLADLLQNERVTVTYLVPSILSMMVGFGNLAGHNLSALRTVLFAGEVFPIKYLRGLVEAIPHAEYYNLYGPTETNVCTYYRVRKSDLARDVPVPIGIACENVEVFAVNDDQEIVSGVGEKGELWVRGPCVAQGYWGDREKTMKSFVRNPFQQHFDELVYRTGDVVMLDEDGVNWRYIGRRDHMVKSRGYRIELGEIESALYAHQSVKEAAVVAVPDDLIGNRLKAFVVPVEGKKLTRKDLVDHCGKRLPRYMIPESVEFSDELPKTSTGKIDRPRLART